MLCLILIYNLIIIVISGGLLNLIVKAITSLFWVVVVVVVFVTWVVTSDLSNFLTLVEVVVAVVVLARIFYWNVCLTWASSKIWEIVVLVSFSEIPALILLQWVY